jgi:phosphate transport system permease protein
MTATVALEMGDTVQNSPHYYALFAVGLALFAITFAVNLVADLALRRTRH